MLLLLSPAKKLDYDSPVRTTLHTQPVFVEQAQALISILKEKSASDVASLMKLSDALATLNVDRYRAWTPEFTQTNSRQAILAFNGDVYEGLQADSLSDQQLQWAQDHLAILSGLYGVLRPLDLMQPYRLEMGTRLNNPAGPNLYVFWGATLADYINRHFQQRNAAESGSNSENDGVGSRNDETSSGQSETANAKTVTDIVLNLASEEYFKAVDKKALKARVVQCVFQDYRNGVWKIISFNAKKARGLMARYVIENKFTHPDQLHAFDSAGYIFAPDVSTPDKLFFRRKDP